MRVIGLEVITKDRLRTLIAEKLARILTMPEAGVFIGDVIEELRKQYGWRVASYTNKALWYAIAQIDVDQYKTVKAPVEDKYGNIKCNGIYIVRI